MMLTRCPACQTVFRLHPEQLHARNGEVRCGHCFNPFNALEHHVSASDDIDDPQAGTSRRTKAATDAPSPTVPAPQPASGPAHPADALDFELPEFPPFDSGPSPIRAEAATLTSDSATGVEPAHDDTYSRLLAPPPAGAIAAETMEQDIASAAMPEVMRSGRHTSPEIEPSIPAAMAKVETAATGADAVAPIEEPAPMPATWTAANEAEAHAPQPEARHVNLEHLDATYGRPRRKASPLLRTLGGMAAGLLAGTLAAQSVYLFRTEIGRELPGLRPLLEAGCAKLGCEVPLPRDIALIGIETSDLQSDPGRPGRYVLHTSVKNRADYAQAWPHLELTLTDASDTPVARRVLAPNEWASDGRMADSLAARATVPVRLAFDMQDASPTGYRLYVFYP